MGQVYVAQDQNLRRKVAVKVLRGHASMDAKFLEGFQARMLALAQFEHPYAVRVYEAAYDDNVGPCIVMELVRGMNLAELVKKNRGRINPARLARLLDQLCEVLQ